MIVLTQFILNLTYICVVIKKKFAMKQTQIARLHSQKLKISNRIAVFRSVWMRHLTENPTSHDYSMLNSIAGDVCFLACTLKKINFVNRVEINRNWIVIILFRLIWLQTEFR